MKFYQKFIKVFRENDGLIRLIITGLGGFVAVGLGYYGFEVWKTGQEKQLAERISTLMKQASAFQAASQELLSDGEGEAADALSNVAASAEKSAALKAAPSPRQVIEALFALYQENPDYKNGGRALYLSANLEFKLGEELEQPQFLTNAKEKYTILYEKHPTHYLAPSALYMLGQLEDRLGNAAASGVLLDTFLEVYPTHFLRGEVLLSKALGKIALKDYEGANRIYEQIINDNTLLIHSDSARRSQLILQVGGYLETVSEPPGFLNPPNPTTGSPQDQNETPAEAPTLILPGQQSVPTAPAPPSSTTPGAPTTPREGEVEEEQAPRLISPFSEEASE